MEPRAVGDNSLNVCYIRVVHISLGVLLPGVDVAALGRLSFQTWHAKFNTRFLLLSYVDLLINNMDSSD
jgi:hypothetical protein